MSTTTEWVTSEERATVEAAIQDRIALNGRAPLDAETLATIVQHAAHMTAAYARTVFQSSVRNNALSIVGAFYPPPSALDARNLSDDIFAAVRVYKERAAPTHPPYRPEPPRNRRTRK